MSENGKVVTSPRFRKDTVAQEYTPEDLQKLQEQAVVTPDHSQIDSIELPEPKRGEQVLGTLTDEECAIFVSFFEARETAENMNRKLSGTVLKGIGEAIEERTEEDFLTGGGLSRSLDMEMALTYFREQRRSDYLKNLLYWKLGERFKAHDFSLGIRSGRRVVKGDRKW